MNGNTPLRFLGVGNMLDREYRNSPAYQWARELARNGIEAGAKTIQFGVEWEGVKASGVYRLQYADDGCGMSRDDLRNYMVTLGRGSKVVGGPHDNYALGSRMSLLPWNPEGVVVISMVQGNEPAMVKLKFDPDAAEGEGEYVLEEVAWENEDGSGGLATVYPPYEDPEYGLNWMDTIPDLITRAGHGTTFILLGRHRSDHTLNGDSERNESHRYLTRKYFNIRFWELPEDVTLRCIELPEDPSDWPKSPLDEGWQFRTVKGARDVAEYVKSSGESTLQNSGTVELADGTKAHWFLRKDGRVSTGGVGSASGFIAVHYRGELYAHAYAATDDGDLRTGAAVYRQFSIGNDSVRKRVFIVLDPPEYDELTGAPGVAPSTGRADLYWLGAGLSPRSVKPGDWAEEFAERMPEPIREAISAAHDAERDSNEDREARMRRVMDRFRKRWRVERARVIDPATANTTTEPTTPASTPRTPIDSPTPTPRPRKTRKKVRVRGRGGEQTVGPRDTGSAPAKTTHIAVGLPDYDWVSAEDIADPGMIAAWQPPGGAWPNGCVMLDKDHPVIRGQIEYWQKQYPPAVAKQIEDIVMEAYATVAIAKVSHIHALSGSVVSEEKREQMLENPSLTASLLGLVSEDALITPRLGGLGAKRRREADEEPATSIQVAGTADANSASDT